MKLSEKDITYLKARLARLQHLAEKGEITPALFHQLKSDIILTLREAGEPGLQY